MTKEFLKGLTIEELRNVINEYNDETEIDETDQEQIEHHKRLRKQINNKRKTFLNRITTGIKNKDKSMMEAYRVNISGKYRGNINSMPVDILEAIVQDYESFKQREQVG